MVGVANDSMGIADYIAQLPGLQGVIIQMYYACGKDANGGDHYDPVGF